MNKPKKRRNDAVNSNGGMGFGWDYEWEDNGNDVECGGYN